MSQKISQFTQIVTLASGDFFPVVQASGVTNKSIQVGALDQRYFIVASGNFAQSTANTALASGNAALTLAASKGDVTLAGTQTLTNKTLTSPVLSGITTTVAGNAVIKPATNILEVQGDAVSVVGQIQLNCHVNSHGQKIASQPHAQAATNTLTLPGGTTIGNSDAVLVSDIGTQTLTNKTLTDPAIIGTTLEDIFTITDAAAFEVDPGNGSIQLITLGASRTPKCTNMVAGESVTLMVDDGTAYTLTWTDATWGTGGVVWKTNAGAAPTLNTSGYTVIVLWKVSTQVYGARVGDA
jgi:hypothetical protein